MRRRKEHYGDGVAAGKGDPPTIQRLIEQLDRDLEEDPTQGVQGTIGTNHAHTSTLDLEDIRFRLRD